MITPKKTVSVIAPAFNESECIDELVRRLRSVLDSEQDYHWEVIFVENGSQDDTWEKIQSVHALDSRFKSIRLARNFRMDGGLTAGLDYVSGDACILMAADLQDPPELIPTFIRKWEEGYENVYGVVQERHGTGPIRRFNSRTFYWLAGRLTQGQIPKDASDFRLLDRRVYEAVKTMQERNRFVRGLVSWVGFTSLGVSMERPPRFAGQSKAFSRVVLDQAFRGIFAHSYVPLRLITVVGLGVSVLAILGLIGAMGLWVFRGVPFGGFGTIVSLVLMLFGVLSFMLGVVSEYVGLIYEEVKGRPNYIVADRLGL